MTYHRLAECEAIYNDRANALGLPELFAETSDVWDGVKGDVKSHIKCPFRACGIEMRTREAAIRHLFLGYSASSGLMDHSCRRKLITMLFGADSPLPGSGIIWYCPVEGCTMTWSGCFSRLQASLEICYNTHHPYVKYIPRLLILVEKSLAKMSKRVENFSSRG